MSIKVSIEHEVDISRAQDLLCSAFEGGSNYWYVIVAQQEPEVFECRTDPDKIYPHIDYPVNKGGWVRISTVEDEEVDGQKIWTLDQEAVIRGMQVFAQDYPSHFEDMRKENDDATTGDVFLQCCLFGKVVFG